MISPRDIRQLIEADNNDGDVLSLYLDMSVNSDNKRTHQVFLDKQRARFAQLDSDRAGHPHEPIGKVFARIDAWLETEYREENRGVAIFAALDGSRFEALQLPVRVDNHMSVGPRMVVGPLSDIAAAHQRHAIVLLDRRTLRVLTVTMGIVEDEHVIRKDEYPAAHDVKAGGEAAKDHQKRKAEETRQFFREFAHELEVRHEKRQPNVYVLLGTTENVRHFQEYLPRTIADRVAEIGHAPIDEPVAELLERLHNYFAQSAARTRAEAVNRLRERAPNRHFAAAGVDESLEQLQEGKVQTLVISRQLEHQGAECTRCGFLIARSDGVCPYCGGELQDGINLAESMVRLAATQEAEVAFVEPELLRELDGVGVLLRF